MEVLRKHTTVACTFVYFSLCPHLPKLLDDVRNILLIVHFKLALK